EPDNGKKLPRDRRAQRVYFRRQETLPWMASLAFGHDHRGAFFDGLADELVSIAFFAPQCHEHAIPFHSPRVVRDAFHWASNGPDDFANWNRRDESFEQHESSTCDSEAF